MSDKEEKPEGRFSIVEYGCILILLVVFVIFILALLAPAIGNIFELGWFQ